MSGIINEEETKKKTQDKERFNKSREKIITRIKKTQEPTKKSGNKLIQTKVPEEQEIK